jgi:outer membrane protein assembly factor BamB
VRFVGPDGAFRWARRLDRAASTMVRSGAMLVVLDGARVVVLDGATGRPRWWMRHGGGDLVPPVGLDGWLWLAGSHGRLEAVDLATGAACRRVDMGDEVVALCPTIAGLVVRTATSGLVMLGPRGTPRFRIHLTAAYSDPVALSDPTGGMADGDAPLPPVGAPLPPTRVLAIAVGDGSVRFVEARTGTELHHVLLEGQPVEAPFSLHMVGGDTVVLAGVGGGLGVHRRIGVVDGT